MHKLRIYMIDPERPGSAQYMFMDREDLRPEMYKLVHEGYEDTTELDELFSRYNKGERLRTLMIRSLSVSDIVVFSDASGTVEGYICRNLGWKKLTDKQVEQLNNNKC